MKLIDKIAYRASIAAGAAVMDMIDYAECDVVKAYTVDNADTFRSLSKETMDDYVGGMTKLLDEGHAYVFYDEDLRIVHCIKLFRSAINTKLVVKMAKLEKRLKAKREASAE